MTEQRRRGKYPDEMRKRAVRTPTREEMDSDVSIPARFEKVMQAVTDGYGTRSRGHYSV